jgi:glucosamine-6-phosphate deaminase
MSPPKPIATDHFGKAQVNVYASAQEIGAAAAERAAGVIQSAIAECGQARIVVATGNSQLTLMAALVELQEIDWSRVEIFHMDEYVGISNNHPASFRYWVRTRLVDKVHPARVEYIEGDAPDLDAHMARYAQLLHVGPLHLAFVGIGENGHIAFNDPGVADFDDPLELKRVVLDDACRRQQVGEGHFPDIASVPREAITLTCPTLFRAEWWICAVSDTRKADAVHHSLDGPISTACPGSLVRRHANTVMFLDTESAALVEGLMAAKTK